MISINIYQVGLTYSIQASFLSWRCFQMGQCQQNEVNTHPYLLTINDCILCQKQQIDFEKLPLQMSQSPARRCYSEAENEQFIQYAFKMYMEVNPHVHPSQFMLDGKLDKTKFFKVYIQKYRWKSAVFENKNEVKRFRDIMSRYFRYSLLSQAVNLAAEGQNMNDILQIVKCESQSIIDQQAQNQLLEICHKYAIEVQNAIYVKKENPELVVKLMDYKIQLQRHTLQNTLLAQQVKTVEMKNEQEDRINALPKEVERMDSGAALNENLKILLSLIQSDDRNTFAFK
ncbi:Hypothetical_protein [Hexamita inflata]|uniref:Hypothetical_protein n=1 Tax=Hexamita inflata TaxID=28002 RepID=A0ABP1H9M1_9EUKA